MVQVTPPEGWMPAESQDDTLPVVPEEPQVEERPEPEVDDTPPPAEPEDTEASDEQPESGIIPPANWASPTELLLKKLVVWAAIPVVTLVIVGSAWLILSSREKEPTPQPEVETVEGPTPPVDSVATGDSDETPLAQLDRRWLPEGTGVVFSLRPSRLAEQAPFGSALKFADSAWRPALGEAIAAFGLELGSIRRISWASNDLSDWRGKSVIVIELEETHDTSGLLPISSEIDIRFGGIACRRFNKSDWPHPFLISNKRTIVTATEGLLRPLVSREAGPLKSGLIDEFLAAAEPDADALFALDLAAARQAQWRMPTTWLDIWPAGAESWRAVWETPQALGITYRRDEPCSTELALICPSEAATEMVRGELEKLVAATGKSLDSGVASLESKKLPAELAERYKTLLAGGSTAMEAAGFEMVDQTVWMRIGWQEDALLLVSAALDSRLTIRADWLDAARRADNAIQARLLAGLSTHQKDKGEYPAGAAGGTLLQPETRLSWIASMLPYYQYEDWHAELSFGLSWDDEQNKPVTQRPLGVVTNPAIGASRTKDEFPVTHYVGVAGVGPGAGDLARDDPKAGLFSFRGATRPENIKDGAANTMALIGVNGQLGSWAAGGPSTVRSLTTAPYVHGPDGFGSGQPEGMSVGMADGSVRFISKDIDPSVLESMATIAGGEAPTDGLFTPAIEPAEPPPEETDTPPVGPDTAAEPVEPMAEPPEETVAEPIHVDVDAQLAVPITKINFPNVALVDAFSTLSQLSMVPITLDLESMWRLGVKASDPITVTLADTTIGEALEAVAASRQLAYKVDNGQILITFQPKMLDALRSFPHAVPGLANSDPATMDRLAESVPRLVTPESWQKTGGRGTIQVEDDSLRVEQTTAVQYDVLTFLEKLRMARGKPLTSELAPERFDVTPRLRRASTALKRPITLNFDIPTPLSRIVSDLAEFSQTNILLDSLSLAALGKSAQTPTTLTVQEQPLGETLAALTEQLGLAYRIIDANTFEITTPQQAATRRTLEFYAVGDLLSEENSIEKLTEKIQQQVSPDAWSNSGGSGVLHYDEPSRSLIVLQSQPVHVLLESLLTQMRVELAEL